MTEDVKRRRYDSTRRREQAAETRRHVIAVAGPLFVEHGYVTTSMRQLADAADVSLQTLYNIFESKFGLFSALLDVVVAGDNDAVAISDREHVRALDDIDDPLPYIEALVEVAVPILERLSTIFPTLRAAASSDPEVHAAYRAFALDARYEPYLKAGRHLAALGALAADLDETAAADIMWTILSPDTHHLLTVERAWTPDRYRNWAINTLNATLVREARERAVPPVRP
jgi:TetR/AcrR family transcriptional regulator of autoinduction and epiphytic fitness